MLTLCRLYLNRVCSTQDNENVSGWRDAYAIASNAAGDHPAFNVSYQSHFEPYAKWIWARWPPTEGLPPRRHGASALSGLNCAFCRADQLAKPAKVASFRGKKRKTFERTVSTFLLVDLVNFLISLCQPLFIIDKER